jgi:AAA domain
MAYEHVPVELRELPQWVVWRREERDGKATKVPYDAKTGQRASSTDPATWTTFDQAAGVAKLGADGVGFVFTADDPFCGVDLDDCRDPATGEVHPAAAGIVQELNSYTELSPSGAGLHVILGASLNGRRNRTSKTVWGGTFECYDRGRFFTVTGDVCKVKAPARCTMVESRQKELDRILDELFPAMPSLEGVKLGEGTGVSDDEVLHRARTAKNGDKFTRLWAGDTSGYPSESEADLALLSVLGFWTQDVDQLKRLFRQSALGRREKSARNDYLERTIETALSSGETYRADSVANGNGRPRLPFRSLAEIMAEVPEEPEWIIPGFIAPSTEVLLSGPPKIGKSTLLFRLLAGIENGDRALGLDVRQVSYLLLSEENAYTLAEKAFDFGLRGRGGEALLFQEARGVTWLEVVQESVERCKEKGHQLWVVDTRWAGLGGESENHAGSIQEAWKPLAAAKEAGLATVVIHHTRKGGGKHGEGIRGSNAIAALPDILLELTRTGGEDPTARTLNANSRYRSTPDVLGLTFDGNDYEVTTDLNSLRSGSAAKVLEELADGPLTKAELADVVGISINALDVHLKRLVEADKIFHTGAGNRQEPYRYHLRTIEKTV